MNDDQFFLANAYVDGELTVDERRIADADPEVMAEVEVLRALRADLADVEGPAATARNAAIAVAMAGFGAAPAASTTYAAGSRPSSMPTPSRPRPGAARFLGIAAAVVAVGLLAVVVGRARSGGDDTSVAYDAETYVESVSGDATLDRAEATTEDTATAANGAAADTLLAESSGDMADEMSSAMSSQEMSQDMSMDMGAPASDSEAGTAGDMAAESTMGPPPTTPPDFDPSRPLRDEFDLGAFGGYLLDEQDAGRMGPTPDTRCPADRFEILGETTSDIGDVATDVYVSVDEASGLVEAVDRTCTIVAVGRLIPYGG